MYLFQRRENNKFWQCSEIPVVPTPTVILSLYKSLHSFGLGIIEAIVGLSFYFPLVATVISITNTLPEANSDHKSSFN